MPRGNPAFKKGWKGGPGRPVGSVNKTARVLKDVWIEAAEILGRDGKGKDGLLGYLLRMAVKRPAAFDAGLIKLIPLHIHAQTITAATIATRDEVIRELQQRGIPCQVIPFIGSDPKTIEHEPIKRERRNGHG